MRRSFVYKARLSPAAIRNAEGQLALCCELYNAALEERKEAWKQRVSISYFTQTAELPGLKELRPELRAISSNVLLNVLKRVDLAFQAFYRRCKAGQKPGHPRFKASRRYSSLTFFAISGWKLRGRVLALQGIGNLRLFLSRPLEGRVKTITLRRDSCGDWWVTFSCEDVAFAPLPATDRSVGVDLGLASLIATSDGEIVPNPRPLIAADAKLRRTHRTLSKQTRGGSNHRKRSRTYARQHRRVHRVRRDFHLKTALDLIRRYDLIAVEDLNVAGLSRSILARSVHDAGWAGFLTALRDGAEKAGRVVVAVDPRGTSQVCSACGTIPEVKKTLRDRVHECLACGYSADRDVNAARNILMLATGEARLSASGLRSRAAA
jgi:putative transposase